MRFRLLTALVAVLLTAAVAPAQSPRADGTVDIQLLAFNDFHGTLEPRAGSSGRIGSADAGGAEYLAAHIARLKAENPNTIVVSGGDNIGASPLLSSMFHDEPAVEALNAAGLQLSAVGNHEFDEGWRELVRIQKGGCHPVDGCQDGTPYGGARYQYLAANVWRGPNRQQIFPATAIRTLGGVKVGFIGLTLRTLAQFVSPAGLRGVTVGDEAVAANTAARRLRRQGVHTIVVLIHQGGTPAGTDINGCEGFSGPIVDLVEKMSRDIDVVVSGHTHEAYVCTIDGRLVTSAANYSRLITDIDLTIDRRTGRVRSKTARNVVVSRDVQRVDTETAVIAHYRPLASTLGSRVVGALAEPLSRTADDNGECLLGRVIADSMLDASRNAAGGGAVAAMMNPGGIRTELLGTAGEGGTRPVTYEQVFDVLPFGNQIVVRTMPGDAIVRMLEQQFDHRAVECGRLLQIAGLSYAFDPSKPAGERVARDSIVIGGHPLVPTQRYRIASNDFIWAGGDGFTEATRGSDPAAVGLDVDLFVGYLQRRAPVRPSTDRRIIRSGQTQ